MVDIPKIPVIKPVFQLGKTDQLPKELQEGWVFFYNSRKAHYVKEGRALCGNWMYLGRTFEQGNDNSIDNCAACKRRLAKLRAKENVIRKD